MIKSTVFTIVGFSLGIVAGFAYGQAVRKNTPSNVKAGYDSGVVKIEADIGNIAKQSLYDMFS